MRTVASARGPCLALLTLASMQASGCTAASEDVATETVWGNASIVTPGVVTSVNGKYEACVGRAGSWSLRVTEAGTLSHPELNVQRDDLACVLLLTEIVADDTYVASRPFVLSTSYQPFGIVFSSASGDAASFLVNARLERDGYDADFLISLSYSQSLAASAGSDLVVRYDYAVPEALRDAPVVPDYTLSFTDGASYRLQLDAMKNVLGVEGDAMLMPGNTKGTTYAIARDVFGARPDYAAVEAAYTSLGPHFIDTPSPRIAGKSLRLVGATLIEPVSRTIIVAREQDGIRHYQLIELVFRPVRSAR